MLKNMTKSQLLLKSGLRLCGMQKEVISGLLSFLRTEEEQWSIIQMIAEGIMNQQPPTQREIAEKLYYEYNRQLKI